MAEHSEEIECPHHEPVVLAGGSMLPEVLAWRCAACGAWVREFGPLTEDDCPVDWRAAVSGSPVEGTR